MFSSRGRTCGKNPKGVLALYRWRVYEPDISTLGEKSGAADHQVSALFANPRQRDFFIQIRRERLRDDGVEQGIVESLPPRREIGFGALVRGVFHLLIASVPLRG